MCAKFGIIVIANNDLAIGGRDLWITLYTMRCKIRKCNGFLAFILTNSSTNMDNTNQLVYLKSVISTPTRPSTVPLSVSRICGRIR